MPGTRQDLENTFAAAVTAFNLGPSGLNTLATFLDQEVTVHSITGHLGYHTKHGVVAYFRSQFADGPNFRQPASPNIVLNSAGTGALISGDTTWTDRNSPGGEPLIFAFTFVFRQGQGWLFSSLWAC